MIAAVVEMQNVARAFARLHQVYLPSALYLCTQDILDSFFVEGFAVTDAHSTLLDLVVSHEAQKRFSMSLRLARSCRW